MKSYPSYKDSGVEWIGEIPSHWGKIKTNFISENLDGRRVPLNSEQRSSMVGEIPYWGSNGIVDHINDYIFNEDLVLVGEDGSPFFDKFKNVSFFVNGKVWINNHIHILKSKSNVIPKYLTHSFNCVDYKEFITGSTRDKLTQSDLSRIPHFIPPLPEQTQIVSFLDTKTKKIDELIEKTEQKIKLLKEKRTSLINHCVTKGLNPDVEIKDSGVEWIGEIPKDWLRTKIIRYCEVKDGTHDTPQYLDEIENTVPLVTSNSFVKGEIDFSKCKRISKEDFVEINKRSDVTENDIIMSMIGSNIGNKVLVNTTEKFSIKNVCLFKTSNSKNLIPKYFVYLLESRYLKIQVDHSQKGGGQPFLSLDELRNLVFPFPPHKQQQKIVKYLDEQTQKIDSNIEKETQRTELLKEYRQSLISEVVTGKIDVSGLILN